MSAATKNADISRVRDCLQEYRGGLAEAASSILLKISFPEFPDAISYDRKERLMTAGLLIICLGILFLLSNLGYIHGSIGHFILPVIFIFIGGSLILKGTSIKKHPRN